MVDFYCPTTEEELLWYKNGKMYPIGALLQ